MLNPRRKELVCTMGMAGVNSVSEIGVSAASDLRSALRFSPSSGRHHVLDNGHGAYHNPPNPKL
jgi:hypothetical protein